jgi:hypothetical protein
LATVKVIQGPPPAFELKPVNPDNKDHPYKDQRGHHGDIP